MSYATLMVYIDVEGKPDGRVSVAADLAQRFDAHLIGIASGAPISVVLGEDAPKEAASETPQLRDLKALLDEKAQQFHAAVGSSGRRVEWRSVVGLQADVVAREARAAISSSLATPARAGIRSGLSIQATSSSRPAGRFWSCRLA
jgi:hypothetical protein